MKINETTGETVAMSKARERAEYWARKRNESTTQGELNHARRMEDLASVAYDAARVARDKFLESSK